MMLQSRLFLAASFCYLQTHHVAKDRSVTCPEAKDGGMSNERPALGWTWGVRRDSRLGADMVRGSPARCCLTPALGTEGRRPNRHSREAGSRTFLTVCVFGTARLHSNHIECPFREGNWVTMWVLPPAGLGLPRRTQAERGDVRRCLPVVMGPPGTCNPRP